MEATLESLGLAPRAALTVTVADDAQRADIFSHTHRRATERAAAERATSAGGGEAASRRRAREQQDRERQREQALAAFREDREGRA